MVNVEGFIKYSNIFEGNTANNTTLPQIIDDLRIQTSDEKRVVLLIDTGLATEDHLALIKTKDYDCVCLSRIKKDYKIHHNGKMIYLMIKVYQNITLQWVEKRKGNRLYIKRKKHCKASQRTSYEK